MQNLIHVRQSRIIICVIILFSLAFSKENKDSLFLEMCFLNKGNADYMDSNFSYLIVSKQNINPGILVEEIGDDYSSEINYRLEMDEDNKPIHVFSNDGSFCVSLLDRKWVSQRCKRSSPHKMDFFQRFVFEFKKLDESRKQKLFGKKFTLHWEYRFKEQKQTYVISGDNVAFISGFCTEEQLNVIRKRKNEK